MIKRLVDIILAGLGLIILSPLLIIIGIIIRVDSKGGIIFQQTRVGKNEQLFTLYKFRTMSEKNEKEKGSQLTVDDKDHRITRVGYYLRLLKLDELPQLINVLKGEMSIVGPRPEVPQYVKMYTPQQKKVLEVRPGMTDYASIEFADENQQLAKYNNPEKAYIQEIMPRKIELNMKYVQQQNIWVDFKLIGLTLLKIFGLK